MRARAHTSHVIFPRGCRNGRAGDLIRECWAAHQGVLCRGVSWERQPLQELLDIAACVGGAGLAALCSLLAEDLAGWSGESHASPPSPHPPPPHSPNPRGVYTSLCFTSLLIGGNWG